MPLISLLHRWKKDPSIGPNIAARLTLPSREPAWADFPPALDSRLNSFLKNQGIRRLYQHQEQCLRYIRQGKNIVISTGTASGKSLSYQLPIIDKILKNDHSKALLLFPTKALARDQLAWLNEFPDIKAFAYDGDTPQNQRKTIRENANIIISNPDMLHIGILPYHTHWTDFFSRLKFIVLDEIHIYRGVFGSHVANLLRRLKRITRHYGSCPQYILTSATIGNPLQLGNSLLEDDLVLIDEDTSSQGEKHFLIYNPPVIDHKFGLRASMQREAVRLSDNLINSGLQTIIFGRSRKSVEFILSRLRERSSFDSQALQAYRSGYLAEQRRELEFGLRSGDIRCIAATTALELGVDIGGLDASVMAGYPGTIAGTWQQAGRSGRGDNPSLAVLVLSATPLDQYIALHPDFLFSSRPENALINANNLLIALAHIKCAAYELPFENGERFGTFDINETSELLSVLENMRLVHKSDGKIFWMSDHYPSADVSLRSTSPQQISLQVTDADGQISLLGTIDQESAPWMIHPGATYFHQGYSYLVESLDLELQKASLIPFDGDYYTVPIKKVELESLHLLGEKMISGAIKYYGEIQVTSCVDAFKIINWNKYELLGTEKLNLPPSILNSMGFWLTLSEGTETLLRESSSWHSSPNNYGPDWKHIRQIVLARDEYICAMCHHAFPDSVLHVHHKTPLRSYSSLDEANNLSNLISLCPRCHQRAEAVVRVNSGLRGLGYLLHNLAPLLLMCDLRDLCLYADHSSPFGSGRPTILLYERVPAGIGFSLFLYESFSELLDMSLSVLRDCPCENGCPGCVGPGGELGSGGKEETKAILDLLCR